jgi:hypothetical protein
VAIQTANHLKMEERSITDTLHVGLLHMLTHYGKYSTLRMVTHCEQYTLVDRLIEPVISVRIILKQNTHFDK